MNDDLKRFVANVKAARIKAGLTCEKLAKEARLSRGYPSLMESWKRDPKLSTIMAIARALNKEPAELMPTIKRRVINAEGWKHNQGD